MAAPAVQVGTIIGNVIATTQLETLSNPLSITLDLVPLPQKNYGNNSFSSRAEKATAYSMSIAFDLCITEYDTVVPWCRVTWLHSRIGYSSGFELDRVSSLITVPPNTDSQAAAKYRTGTTALGNQNRRHLDTFALSKYRCMENCFFRRFTMVAMAATDNIHNGKSCTGQRM